MVKIEDFATLVPLDLLNHSGKVFYSGRNAFTGIKPLYLLGFNPGGDPSEMPDETLRSHSQRVLQELPSDWSEYDDESWVGSPPGSRGLQPRVRHLAEKIGLDLRSVPLSNLVFTRSRRAGSIRNEWEGLALQCWPFHSAVIAKLSVKVIACFGQDAGHWVRQRLNAAVQIDQFVESNSRRWRSEAFRNEEGVLSLAHPSIANWTDSPTDPSALVRRVLAS